MKKKWNILTFIENEEHKEEMDKDLTRLITFTTSPKRNLKNSQIKLSNKGEYIFTYKEKEYFFSLLEDKKIQQVDKEILKNKKIRLQEHLKRSLKLACSMDLINPKIVIGKSKMDVLNIIIIYQEKGIEKIIDYKLNLIMNKDDYYELFNFKDINVVTKYDLYNIYHILKIRKDYQYLIEYLIFTKEIFNELSKKEEYSFLNQKYDKNGINRKNTFLIGDNSDNTFFTNKDNYNRKYEEILKEIDSFTKNPAPRKKHIKHDENATRYIFTEKSFGFFKFSLLSDGIDSEEEKQKLLSDKRYHHCHSNSIILAASLSEEDKEQAYVVSGKIRCNDIDYYYHSWIEIDNKNVVIDYNRNIIMNRDKYYKLYGAISINKTLIKELQENLEIISQIQDDSLNLLLTNYFNKEIAHDIKKSKILKK